MKAYIVGVSYYIFCNTILLGIILFIMSGNQVAHKLAKCAKLYWIHLLGGWNLWLTNTLKMLSYSCSTCIRHKYSRNIIAYMSLECPIFSKKKKKKEKEIGILVGWPKRKSKNFINIYFILDSILNNYLLYTLLDLGLYSLKVIYYLMTMCVFYYP